MFVTLKEMTASANASDIHAMLSLIHAYNTIDLGNRQGEDGRVQSADRRNGEGELGLEITCTDASLET